MVSLASSENTIRAGGNICWVGVDGSISDHYYPKAPGPDEYPYDLFLLYFKRLQGQ